MCWFSFLLWWIWTWVQFQCQIRRSNVSTPCVTVLPECVPNCRGIGKLCTLISCFRDVVRSYNKLCYMTTKRSLGCSLHIRLYSSNMWHHVEHTVTIVLTITLHSWDSSMCIYHSSIYNSYIIQVYILLLTSTAKTNWYKGTFIMKKWSRLSEIKNWVWTKDEIGVFA